MQANTIKTGAVLAASTDRSRRSYKYFAPVKVLAVHAYVRCGLWQHSNGPGLFTRLTEKYAGLRPTHHRVNDFSTGGTVVVAVPWDIDTDSVKLDGKGRPFPPCLYQPRDLYGDYATKRAEVDAERQRLADARQAVAEQCAAQWQRRHDEQVEVERAFARAGFDGVVFDHGSFTSPKRLVEVSWDQLVKALHINTAE